MKNHAVLVILNENKEVLFVQRSMKKKTLPGAWSFPSGTIEGKESVFATIIREGNEELGVTLQPIEIFAEKELSEFSVKLSFVLCNIVKGTPVIAEPEEIDNITWMTFQDFFYRFSDNVIGHGLVWLRQHPQLWNNLQLR